MTFLIEHPLKFLDFGSLSSSLMLVACLLVSVNPAGFIGVCEFGKVGRHVNRQVCLQSGSS